MGLIEFRCQINKINIIRNEDAGIGKIIYEKKFPIWTSGSPKGNHNWVLGAGCWVEKIKNLVYFGNR